GHAHVAVLFGTVGDSTRPTATVTERNKPYRQVRLAGFAAQSLHLTGIAGAALHNDAEDVGMGDIGLRLASHQAGVLGDDFEAITRRQINRADHILHGIGVGIIELDVLKALLLTTFELLAHVLFPARSARIDLAFVVLLGGIRCVQIGAIAAGMILIEQIAVSDADAAPGRRARAVGDLGYFVVSAGPRSVGPDQV